MGKEIRLRFCMRVWTCRSEHYRPRSGRTAARPVCGLCRSRPWPSRRRLQTEPLPHRCLCQGWRLCRLTVPLLFKSAKKVTAAPGGNLLACRRGHLVCTEYLLPLPGLDSERCQMPGPPPPHPLSSCPTRGLPAGGRGMYRGTYRGAGTLVVAPRPPQSASPPARAPSPTSTLFSLQAQACASVDGNPALTSLPSSLHPSS